MKSDKGYREVMWKICAEHTQETSDGAKAGKWWVMLNERKECLVDSYELLP